MTPRPMPEDIVKVALGPKDTSNLGFSDWELLLAEIALETNQSRSRVSNGLEKKIGLTEINCP